MERLPLPLGFAATLVRSRAPCTDHLDCPGNACSARAGKSNCGEIQQLSSVFGWKRKEYVSAGDGWT